MSFGKAPEVVCWEKVKQHAGVSPFARDYQRVRDLAMRAQVWKQVFDPVLPGIFLAWARRLEIAVAKELVEHVEARGVVIGDWKDLHDKLRKQFDVIVEDRDKLADACRSLIPERDQLKARIAALSTLVETTHQTKLLVKLREAVEKFWNLYDPGDPSTAPTNEQVTDWLVERGVAKRVAEVMAQILRADGLSSGPRK